MQIYTGHCKNYSVKITSRVIIVLSVHWLTWSCCHDGGRFYIYAISTFDFVYTCIKFPVLVAYSYLCFVFVHAQLAVMRDISIVHLNRRCFNHCPCHLELEVALRLVHRLTIVNESYSSHDKEKEQCLLLCIVLNHGVSKLPSYHCSNSICCTPCIGFVFVHNWLSQGCLCYLHGTWSIANNQRNGKFT